MSKASEFLNEAKGKPLSGGVAKDDDDAIDKILKANTIKKPMKEAKDAFAKLLKTAHQFSFRDEYGDLLTGSDYDERLRDRLADEMSGQ
jgi:hypothetical protein